VKKTYSLATTAPENALISVPNAFLASKTFQPDAELKVVWILYLKILPLVSELLICSGM